MRRLLAAAVLVASFGFIVAVAQTPTTTDLSQNTPTENLKTARTRNPGSKIQSALNRHRGITDAIVNAPRSGSGASNSNSSANSGTSGTTGTAGTTGTGGLGDLSGLLGLLGGLGGSTGTTGTTGSTGTTGTSGLGSADLSALIQLAQLGGLDVNSLISQFGGLASPRENDATGVSEAIANFRPADGAEFTVEDLVRLRDLVDGDPGATAAGRDSTGRSQSTTPPTTTTRKFRLRLADRLVTSIFSTLTNPLAQALYVQLFRNALNPLFPDSDNSNSNVNSNLNQNSNTSGGSIDDLPPAGNSNTNSLV